MLCVAFSNAQNVATSKIQWNVTKTFNALAGESDQIPQKFIVDRTNIIQWVDIHDNLKFNFTIVSQTGTWSNVNTPGGVQYDVDVNGVRGKVEITRTSAGISIRVNIFMDEPQIYELTISDVQVL